VKKVLILDATGSIARHAIDLFLIDRCQANILRRQKPSRE
jgi:hypothetical protein